MKARKSLPAALAAVLVGAALASPQPARAGAPIALDSDADVAAFARQLRNFSGASRVRWVVAAPTKGEAEARIAAITGRLAPSDRFLAARLVPQADASPSERGAARAWIAPQFGSSGDAHSCSWQVWVTDPGFPAADGRVLSIPMAPNDRLPVGPAATFRVGHSGLLQSKLYAFDETDPGAIRDLATAPDVNIPVAAGSSSEIIYLAMTREAAPFLDSVKTALASSNGQRLALGPQYSLRGKLIGQGRGIGANIQSVGQKMIVAEAAPAATAELKVHAEARDALTESCLFALAPESP